MSALLPIHLDHLMPFISAWLYAMLRVSSFFLATPLFSQLAIPTYIRIILSIVISAIFVPQFIITTPLPSPYTGAGIIAVFQQMIIGIAMGLILQMVFEVLNLALLPFNLSH